MLCHNHSHNNCKQIVGHEYCSVFLAASAGGNLIVLQSLSNIFNNTSLTRLQSALSFFSYLLISHTNLYHKLPRALQRTLSRGWYERIAEIDHNGNITFMNYGWANVSDTNSQLSLLLEDKINRYCIQLYHRVAAAVNLHGLNGLEIGSGRRGGASYHALY